MPGDLEMSIILSVVLVVIAFFLFLVISQDDE